MFLTHYSRLALLFTLSLFLGGCGGSINANNGNSTETSTSEETITKSLNPDYFVEGALASAITTEACTLTNGSSATCYRIEIAGVPADQPVGNFCPRSIYDEANDVGIWFDGSGEVYDLDGDFITNLASHYGDANWLLYDVASGDVNVTLTQAACDGAARPNVAEEYQNHCVECSLDYVDGGITQTYLIPVTPVPASTPQTIRNVGVSLNGVNLAAPAPVDAILGAYTIAAFDDCAGHINLVAGYHYHGAAGCTEIIEQEDGHAKLMGYALDGYGIYGMLGDDNQEPSDLDACRGHEDTTRGYHYHAASVAENMFIGCFSGETAR